MDLLPLAFRNSGFKSHQRHGGLSLVSVVCCQVDVMVSCGMSSKSVIMKPR